MSDHHELMRYFNYEHLPPHLQDVSAMFFALADNLDKELPQGNQKFMALQKLLEAKDCAVRARIG